MRVLGLFRNSNFIFILALGLGLTLGDAARWTRPTILPILALVITLSSMQISSPELLAVRKLGRAVLLGVAFNYLLLGTVILVLARWLMPDNDLWAGFVIVAAAPPAVAVIPFSYILRGDTRFSLHAVFGGYLAALVLTPLMAFFLLGENLVSPYHLAIVLVELIIVPLLLSRILLASGLSPHIDRYQGTIVNWCFFVVFFTVVGLNRKMFFQEFSVLGSVSAVGLASTFGLGSIIGGLCRKMGVNRERATSLMLLGTLKNCGLAAAVSLALLPQRASIPASVMTVFLFLYVIWLNFRGKR